MTISEEENSEAVPLQNGHAVAPKQNFCQRVNNFRKLITVEPAAFMMLAASILAAVTTQTLSLEKTCRVNLNLSDAICDAVRNQDSENNTANERLVQEYVAGLLAWRSVITSVLPCLILAFVGGWMDVTGRRTIIMILPVLGEVFQNISNILNVIFYYELKVESLIFLDGFFGSIAGGWSVMFLAIFSYIADITTEENRTHRLGLVSFCTYVGMPIGLAISGVMLRQLGYLAIYGTCATLHILNIIYITCFIQDPARTREQKKHDGRGFFHFLKTFFNLAHFRDTFKVLFMKTENNRRKLLIILIFAICLLFGPMYGEISILYMSTRYRFNWDEVQFSIFQTYNFIVHTAGTIFTILFFSKYLQWHDSVLGIISTISKITASFAYCFAPNERIFYIAPVLDVLNGTALLAIRSIFSKSVEPYELGKVNSIVSLTENLMPLVYVSLYTKVYTSTMEVLPGAAFLMGAALTVPALGVFMCGKKTGGIKSLINVSERNFITVKVYTDVVNERHVTERLVDMMGRCCKYRWLFYKHRKSLKTEKTTNGTTEIELQTS